LAWERFSLLEACLDFISPSSSLSQNFL
jgi:hypothetical protein